MLSFAASLWLVGLVLLPAIRWLHRAGRHRRAVPVSRLDLWRGCAASSPVGGERRPPDPAWRRRALLAALLFVALAEPQLPEQRRDITLWIDDSLSMLTREAQGTRLDEGLAQARSLLAEAPLAQIEVRTLGDPWRDLGPLTDASVAAIVAGAGRREAAAPPGALMRRDRKHWLLTDGAHAAAFDWPGERRPDRVIVVASVTRNVGLERLSARRSLNDPERYDLLLTVANGGTEVETRDVVFATDAGEIVRSTLRLDPGASTFVSAVIPRSMRILASLQPGDALAEDDAIALDLAPLRRRLVAIDAKCPRPLVAAVEAHPALAAAGAGSVEVVLDCGTPAAAGDVPTIRARADHPPTHLRGPVQWSSSVPESRRIPLDPEQMPVAARLEVLPADVVLLAVGDEPLIVDRGGASKLVEISLDFASTGSTRRPEMPLLVNLAFERLLGGQLLDEIAIADRGAGSARVAPSSSAGATASAVTPERTPSTAGPFHYGTLPLLAVALLVLLWEMAALGRQWHQSIGRASEESR